MTKKEKRFWTEPERVRWTMKGGRLSEKTQSFARRFIDETK